jgi:hypothetical protein
MFLLRTKISYLCLKKGRFLNVAKPIESKFIKLQVPTYTAVGIIRLVYLGFNFGLVQNQLSRNAALQVNTVPLRKD